MKIFIITLLASVALLVMFNVLYIRFAGTNVPVPDIPRQPLSFGTAEGELKFAVLGDSLTVGQGGDYQKGIAVTAARGLAKNHKVSLLNVGVSGARTKDVLNNQLPKVTEFKPDVVLLTVSANDINHMTSLSAVEDDFRKIIAKLKTANSEVKIIITGAPAMGSVPRFPWPTSAILGSRVATMNRRFDRIVADEGLFFARVADRTGKQFAEDDSLSAEDKFHPSDKGYALWNEVISEQIDMATK